MSKDMQIYVRFEYEVFGDGVHKDIVGLNFGECLPSTTMERALNCVDYITSRGLRNLQNTRDNHTFLNNCVGSLNNHTVAHDMTAQAGESIAKSVLRGSKITQASDFNYLFFDKMEGEGGKLLIDVSLVGNDLNSGIKYAFLSEDMNKIMSASEYMSEQDPNWKKFDLLNRERQKACNTAVTKIEYNCALMTKDEIKDFVCYDYVGDKMRVREVEKNRKPWQPKLDKVETQETYAQMTHLGLASKGKNIDDPWGDAR